MQRLLRLLGALALCAGLAAPALADSTVHGLATSTTSPVPANSCFYVDQGPGTDTKLCSGYATAIGALAAANNLSDLASASTARTNLGLGALATLSSVNLTTQATGTLQAGQFPALTGDVTTVAGALATTLATVNSSPGSTTCSNITTNGKGLVTANTNGSCSGGGSLTVTDGTNSVASTTTLSLGNGFGVSGTSPTANVAMVAPDRTLTASGGSVAATDMAGQINLNGSSLSFNVSAIGAGVWNTGASAILNDLNSTSVTLTNTATVNGCGTTLYSGGFFSYTSNGTSLDCFGFPGFGWMAANAITVSTVTGKSRVVTSGSTDTLLSSDCGEEVIYNNAAYTVTVPSAIVPASGSVCTIRIRTATGNKVTISGSGVTVTSADSYTGTQAIAGSGISLDLTTVGATATAYLDGHGS